MATVLRPFSKQEDLTKARAASEVASVFIPFRHEDYLQPNYSDGVTDRCFFLKSKTDGQIYPWNDQMAQDGNVRFFPHFDLELLNDEQFAGEVALWRKQGILPAGYTGTTEAPAQSTKIPMVAGPKDKVAVAKQSGANRSVPKADNSLAALAA